MNYKVCIGLAVALFACCAQADLNKFGDLGTGERAGDLLGADSKELETKLDREFASYGKHYACSKPCFDKLVRREYASTQAGERDLDKARCQRLARFERLCELVRQQRSGNVRVLTIERWLCLTSRTLALNLSSGYFKCQEVDGFPQVFQSAAEKELNSVLSYSFQELKGKERELAEQFEADKKLRREIDEKIIKEAFSKVNKGIERLPEYMECSKRQVIEKAREANIRAGKKAEERHRSEMRQQQSDYEDKLKRKNDDMAALSVLGLAALGAGR